MKLTTLALLFAAALFAPAPINCAGRDCGVKPAKVKPVPPPGCRDMELECVCDDRGANCSWKWACKQ